jgi:hypothetical protein
LPNGELNPKHGLTMGIQEEWIFVPFSPYWHNNMR